MRASDYIGHLQNLIDQHGDLELVDSNDNAIGVPELSDDLPGEPDVFVVCSEA